MLAQRTLLKGAAGRSAFLGRHWPLLLALGIAAGQQQLRSSSVTVQPTGPAAGSASATPELKGTESSRNIKHCGPH